VAEHRLELVVQPILGHLRLGKYGSAVAGEGDAVVRRRQVRSSRTAWVATSSSENIGASLVCSGFSPLNISASDLPTIWMLPIGKSKPVIPK
jgi:hypothetical protein